VLWQDESHWTGGSRFVVRMTADTVTVLPDQREMLESWYERINAAAGGASGQIFILQQSRSRGVRKKRTRARCLPRTSAVIGRLSGGGTRTTVTLLERLADAPRSGRRGDVPPEQICAVVARTCPEAVGERTPDQPMSQARNCRRGH